MRQKTRILIYILVAIAVVIMGTISILNNYRMNKPLSVQEHIDLGRIYLSELSYEKAVLEFTEAIEIDPLNADAYLGLAEAHVGMGNTENAVEILEEGYCKTGDERIKDMMESLQPIEEPIVTTTVPTFTASETTSDEKVSETNSEVTVNEAENRSYTIDVISDKEAHIEIFDDIINNEYIIERDFNYDENAFCMARYVEIDNLQVGVWVWEFNTPWRWNQAYAQVFIENKDLGYYLGQYYDITCDVDTSENKLSIDVVLPKDFDFSFNDYKSIELKTGQEFWR